MILALASTLSACGGRGSSSFQKLNSCQSYALGSEVSRTVRAPVDVLFVVDNSGSMGAHQTELQNSFSAFSSQYLQPDSSGAVRDLRMAFITTDTYFADLTSAGKTYSAENAKLLPGVHDGEFYSTMTSAPGKRTGRPILSSIPSDGNNPDAAYLASLNLDFTTNAKVGVRGNGNESGMASLKRFINLNESPCLDPNLASRTSCFFRKNSFRVVFFMSDSKDFCESANVSSCMHGSVRAFDMKSTLESFLAVLDGGTLGSIDPKLFSIALIAETDPSPNDPEIAIHYSDLLDLWRLAPQSSANSMGQYSKTLALGKDSITDALNAIGQTIEDHAVTHTSVFNLPVEPASVGQTDFYVVTPDHSRTAVPKSSISIQNSVMSIDAGFIKQFPTSSTLEGCFLPKN